MRNTYLVLSILCNFFLASCSKDFIPSYSLLSDNPQMALVIDLYNSLNPERTPFVFHYVKEIRASDLTNNKFDVIVGKNLSRFSSYFKNIHFLKRFLPNTYQEILARYKNFFNSKRMLPLAFDLPVILSNVKDTLPLFLSLDELLSLQEVQLKKGSPFLAFSPFSNPYFLWYWSILQEVDWHTNVLGELNWNKLKLDNFLLKVKNWTQEEFYQAQEEFSKKYSYLGELHLLKRAYMKACFSTLAQWRNYIMENESISYSFLTNGNNLIALQDDTTYVALSLFTRNSRDSNDFMRWLTSFEGQSQIIKVLKEKLPYPYGFLNGFSFLHEVNTKTISQEYPELAGRLPDLEYLKLSYPLPYSLKPFLKQVWYAWLEACLRQEDTKKTLEAFIKEALLFDF